MQSQTLETSLVAFAMCSVFYSSMNNMNRGDFAWSMTGGGGQRGVVGAAGHRIPTCAHRLAMHGWCAGAAVLLLYRVGTLDLPGTSAPVAPVHDISLHNVKQRHKHTAPPCSNNYQHIEYPTATI